MRIDMELKLKQIKIYSHKYKYDVSYIFIYLNNQKNNQRSYDMNLHKSSYSLNVILNDPIKFSTKFMLKINFVNLM